VTYSLAQYQAVTEKVSSGAEMFGGKIGDVTSACNAALGSWWIPGFVKDAVRWLCQKIVDMAESLWQKIADLLRGAAAPAYMFEYAYEWAGIRGTASTVAGELTLPVVGISQDWQGAAATAYSATVAPQSSAAGEVATISTQTATALTTCAAAALLFYLAIGVIVFQAIASLTAAVIALASLIFSWAGIAMAVGEISVSSGMAVAAVSTLSAALGAQASQMATLHGAAVDNTSFPGGHWPRATTGI
jgi:uncharacterized protein YukE